MFLQIDPSLKFFNAPLSTFDEGYVLTILLRFDEHVDIIG
jgi:hypothetical protein